MGIRILGRESGTDRDVGHVCTPGTIVSEGARQSEWRSLATATPSHRGNFSDSLCADPSGKVPHVEERELIA